VKVARAAARGAGRLAVARRGRPAASDCAVRRYDVPGLVIDVDGTLVTCHSEKERRTHVQRRVLANPLLAWLDNTEALAGDAASGERERQHRRRPHHRDRGGVGADPRRLSSRYADPVPRDGA
jgi:hypothetical protein